MEGSTKQQSGQNLGNRFLDFLNQRHQEAAGKRTVHVIANPAAGQEKPVLKTLNSVFTDADINWEILITKKSGDGRRLAALSVEMGVDVVAVFGGDGTVVDVASGLTGSRVPLGILPGGTANMMSRAMGIPQDLEAAAKIIASQPLNTHQVYLGQAGEIPFFQVVGIGTEARINQEADRAAKDRMGGLAYFIAGLRAITNPEQAHYRLEFEDGRVIEDDGVTCLLAKVGNLGIPTLENSPETAHPDAALMDIVIIRRVDLPTLMNLANTLTTGGINPDTLPHWQAHRVNVRTDPPQAIQADGEVVGETPVSVEIIPQPVQVIVPEETLIKKGKDPAEPK